MNKLTALLIDDDKKFCQTFQLLAENIFDLEIAHSGRDGLALLNRIVPQVVLLDLKLGRGMNGLEVLKRIKQSYPDMPVIMITDFADVETAVKAMKLGALHYNSKLANINALKLIIERELEQINWKLLYQDYTSDQFDQPIAESPAMQSVFQDIRNVAKTRSTVLIEGESGTGKEVTAREIHRQSHRRDKPFVAINCSTLTPHLFESEFFGHEKGAFTDARYQQKGKLELAHTGTIFLDEIGDLPLESQAKILRAIEDKSFQRLGGTQTFEADVRIITATNKNLTRLVHQKIFREDLFYRLSVFTIKLPALRDRREDIPLLVDMFLQKFAREMNKKPLELTAAALAKLLNYHWQGNIRELRNFIEQLVVRHSDKSAIDAHDIPLNSENESFRFPVQLLDTPYEPAKQTLIDNFKRVYFQRALGKHNGNITTTAKHVGINRSSLHKMLRALDIR